MHLLVVQFESLYDVDALEGGVTDGADPRLADLEDLINRPGTYFNPQTEVLLVVDDSLTVRELERKMIESLGYTVDVAVDGMDGWNAMRAGHYDLVVTDVAPFTLGVEVSKRLGHEHRSGYFLPMIERNTTIPVSRVQRLSTLEPNQTTIQVKIYQGEGRRVEDNLFLGEFELAGIPRGPAGQDVDIRFTYDLNGVLEVEALIVATKKKVSHVITRHTRGLSQEQVQHALKDMEKLKTHPREEALKRFAIHAGQ